MKSGKRIANGIYHNGQGNGYTFKYPHYSLFKLVPDDFDSIQTVMYSLVATYDNGEQSNWLYDNEQLAVETFKLMID